MKRVVITGAGTISGLGNSFPDLVSGIQTGKSAVQFMPGWDSYKGLNSQIAAPAKLENERSIPRKARRSMGRISIMAVQAADEALASAGIEKEDVKSDRVGCIMGSTMGGPEALNNTFETIFPNYDLSELTSMQFFKCVSHTVAMNVSQYLGLKGTVMATSSACASSLQAMGTAYDLIRLGRQDVILCGGSEEVHPTVTGTFDILMATSSKYNESPEESPRPFDKNRDGLVCGEGAGVLVLEEYEHAVSRGATILAEIIGYSTCGSGSHVSQSDRNAMEQCFNQALDDAGISASDVDYISAHATATIQGDIEEAAAISNVFGDQVPVSSLKGYIGHTLGASGSIELAVALEMMKEGTIYPTRNLVDICDDCNTIMHVKKPLEKELNIIVKNCFAFGGINAVLVCKKCNEDVNE